MSARVLSIVLSIALGAMLTACGTDDAEPEPGDVTTDTDDDGTDGTDDDDSGDDEDGEDGEDGDGTDDGDGPDDADPDGDHTDADALDAHPDVPPDPLARLAIVAPVRQLDGGRLPIRVHALDADGNTDAQVSGVVSLSAGGTPFDVLLRRGVGASTITVGDDAFAIDAPGFDAEPVGIAVAGAPDRVLAGRLDGEDLAWGPGEIVAISDDVTVPAGETLTVAEGVTVRLDEDANVLVEGDIYVSGSADAPVLFAAADPDAAWGGIVVDGLAGLTFAFFVDGGGDDSREWGHSDSQAVVFGNDGADIRVVASAFVDNPGKSMGSLRARVRVEDSLVTRCDTGGEFRDSHAVVQRSWFLDMPVIDGEFIDDDNDAIYFWGVLEDEGGEPLVSRIEDSTFIGGLDDGIDHNGAVMTVEGAWVEGFWHEGIAASNGGSIAIRDAWVTDCEQGLEAGGVYGGAFITADHVVLTGNDVDVRWGDSSDPGLLSTMIITNSVIADARDEAVRNYHSALGGPNPDADIRIEHSLVDDPEWAAGPGSIEGDPVFGDDGLLAPDSPGYEAGSDGLSMGLSRPLR